MSWDLIEEAKRLIGIRSISVEGNRKAAEFVEPFCRNLGFNITRQLSETPEQGDDLNLIAHTVPNGSADLCPNGLLWVTHLDTVPPGDPSLWTETEGDPFKATIKGDQIYGLGSADTKVDILCKLKAIEKVGLKNLKVPFSLTATYGEERGIAGAKRLRSSGIMHPRWALVSEASDLQPVLRHKGILYMRVVFSSPLPLAGEGLGVRVFEGRAAHGATPHLGVNAIEIGLNWLFEEQKKAPNLQLVKMEGGTVHNVVPEKCVVTVAMGNAPCSRIQFLRNFWQLIQIVDQKIEADQDKDFDPPVTTRNIGVLQEEKESLFIEFDYRLLPSTDGNKILEILRKIEETPGARLEVLSSNPPLDTYKDSEIVRRVTTALESLGQKVKHQVKAGNTEGAILSQMGTESIVIGSGTSVGNIHRPNEHNQISQLKKAVEFYAEFLRGFC